MLEVAHPSEWPQWSKRFSGRKKYVVKRKTKRDKLIVTIKRE